MPLSVTWKGRHNFARLLEYYAERECMIVDGQVFVEDDLIGEMEGEDAEEARKWVGDEGVFLMFWAGDLKISDGKAIPDFERNEAMEKSATEGIKLARLMIKALNWLVEASNSAEESLKKK